MLFYYDKITVVACGKYLSLDYCPISVAFVILKPKICILSVICGYNRILTDYSIFHCKILTAQQA